MEGIVIVNTGGGKGKTTAAMGMVLRNLGYNKKICVIGFLKSPDFETGEQLFLKNNNVEYYCMGAGFTWEKTAEEHREALRNAIKITEEKLSGDYDLVVLDELNYVFSVKDFKTDDICSVDEIINLVNNRKKEMTVIITGNNAPEKLISFADLVTEMKMIKHPFNNGKEAQKGIEF